MEKKPIKKKRNNKEEQLQVAVSAYVRMNYPDVIFTAESSGVRMNIGQAMKLKAQRSKGKLPDLIVLEPKGRFHGLILELKEEGSSPYMKSGLLLNNEHVQLQNKTLVFLVDKGYYADFAVGYSEAIRMINDYMKL